MGRILQTAESEKDVHADKALAEHRFTHILLTVRDSGPGLDPKGLDRFFNAFYTTKPKGMGMGLAISHSIIEAHGGHRQFQKFGWYHPNPNTTLSDIEQSMSEIEKENVKRSVSTVICYGRSSTVDVTQQGEGKSTAIRALQPIALLINGCVLVFNVLATWLLAENLQAVLRKIEGSHQGPITGLLLGSLCHSRFLAVPTRARARPRLRPGNC
jgi:hypothetical protein